MRLCRWYPVNLSIAGKKIVIIGGGSVAERKVKNIIKCGGIVTVVSPDITRYLLKLSLKKTITYIQDTYKENYLTCAFLAYAATSARKVNNQIARDAKAKGVPLNVCDSKDESSFIVPAVFSRKGITVSVSTGGISPSKAVYFRNKLKEWMQCHY